MATNYYLRSAAGGTGTGLSWANAFTTMAAAFPTVTNADTLWVADDHVGSTAGAVTITFPSSPGCRVLCANTHVTEPPTGLATSASESVGAASNILTISGFAYVYGVAFQGGTNNSASCTINIQASTPNGIVFDTCPMTIRTTNASGFINIGQTGSSSNDDFYVKFINCPFKFGATGGQIRTSCGVFHFQGLTLDGAGSIPTTLFSPQASTQSRVLVEASDLSGRAFTNLVNVANATPTILTFRQVKMPGGINVTTGSNPGIGGPTVLMHDCDSADTHIRFAEHTWQGSVVQQTSTLVLAATQKDSTLFSWLMNGSGNSTAIYAPLQSPEMAVYNTSTGSSKTVTVEILRDNATALKDNEVWLEIIYLGTSGTPLGTVATDRAATVIASGTNQDSSSAAWDTTGMGAANKQKLVVTFTPQEAGYIIGRVMLAANTSIYVDPVMTVA